MIPFVDLKSQYARLKSDIDGGIHAVLDSGAYVMGPAVKQFEAEMAAWAGAKHCVSCSSGSDALLIALLAMGIGRGDAVFVPSFTYTATAESILLVGAVPVFVEVDPDTFLIDVAYLERMIDETAKGDLRPAAIMPVDLFGQPCDYPAIDALAKAHGMRVIADAAQGFGGTLDGAKVGTLADVTATSFYPSKPLGCYGDGGALLTEDDELRELMNSVRLHGKGAHKYDVQRVGINGRLDSIQAAVLSAKLSVFDDALAQRARVARAYDAALSDVVKTPARVPGATSAWAQYTIRTSERDALQAACKEAGVPTMVFYAVPMHLQPAYRAHGGGEGSLPVSERVAHEVVSLPMNPYLSDAQVAVVTDAIRGFAAKATAAE